MIYFYSTHNRSLRASLKEAVMKGLAEDGGLFMPDNIPRLPHLFFSQMDRLSFAEIAFEISQVLLQDAISSDDLKKIVEKSMTFDAPLKEISSNIYSLELFHGPTLSFKDFGARFMAQLMEYFTRNSDQTLHILVATSGDTGSAIGNAFLNVPGIRVWILYPKGKVSEIQEKQLTTLGNGITALEIEGSFDDCQTLVKQAFSDQDLRKKLSLTSANSINIARLIPQSFYYFYAYAQLKKQNDGLPIVFAVPSGNFGNLTAGLLAKAMGLPVNKLVAATNINDSIPKYLHSGLFQPHPSHHTLSNAMDVGNPSNFARMLDLYQSEWKHMRQEIIGVSFTDEQTISAIRDVYSKYHYLMDPHGAVAYLGLHSYLRTHPEKIQGVFLETAHPAKFADEVEKMIGKHIPIPENLQKVLKKEKHSLVTSPKYEDFRRLLLTPTHSSGSISACATEELFTTEPRENKESGLK